MGVLKRLFGICETLPPADAGCWTYAEGKIEIVLDLVPELSQPGGAIRLEGHRLPRRVLVLHGQDGKFHALPNRCTHLGHRRLDPVPGEETIRCCSISKSVFDYSGKNISGAARQPLTPFQVETEPGKLIISLE